MKIALVYFTEADFQIIVSFCRIQITLLAWKNGH